MATFLKLLLFGCICLSACSQQNRGVRSADELFKELESAYQKKDSVAFEKFFKEWNEISKDSMNAPKLANDTIREVYNIANDFLFVPTQFFEGDTLTEYNTRYGVLQTSISFLVKDTAGNIVKKDSLHNFYPKSRKKQDSILFAFPEYEQAYRWFWQGVQRKIRTTSDYKNRNNAISQWIFYNRYYGLFNEKISEVQFIGNLENAQILYGRGYLDEVHVKTLKKENGHWKELSDEMYDPYNPFIEAE